MLGLVAIARMIKTQRSLQRTSIQIVGTYLGHVMEYALNEIKRLLGDVMGADGRPQPRTHVILTTPGT